MIEEYKICFWNPGFKPQTEDRIFGCSTMGMFHEGNWIEPNDDRIVTWKTLKGEAFSGTYAEILNFCQTTSIKPTAILTFLVSDEGNDEYVESLQKIFPKITIQGGTAAKNDDAEAGEVLPAGKNSAIFLITEGNFETDYKRVHDKNIELVKCSINNHRLIEKINGFDASEYLSLKRKELNKPGNDFESITFHESCGKNVHCSEGKQGTIYAGANLEENELTLFYIDRNNVNQSISSYMQKENALSIGCAGLKTLLTETFPGASNNVGLFLFGEIVPYSDGKSRFSNLMMTRLLRM